MSKRMRIFTILLSFLMIFSLALAACAPDEDAEEPVGSPGLEETPLIEETPLVETPMAETPAAETPMATQAPEAEVLDFPMFASNMLDFAVWNVTDEEIADTDGLIMDMTSGAVNYVLVEENENDIPVPWSAFQIIDTDPTTGETFQDNLDELAFLLTVDDVTLESAPSLTEEQTEAIGEVAGLSEWEEGVRNYWSAYVETLPVTGQEQGGVQVLIEEGGLFGGIDFDVEGVNGNDLGDIEDFIVMPDGTAQWALMQTDAFLGIGAERLLVPFEQLSWDVTEGRFLLPVDEAFLDQAIAEVGIEDEADLDLTDETFDDQFEAFWVGFVPVEPAEPIEEPAEEPVGAAADEFRTVNVIGTPLTTADGTELGTVEDVLVSETGETYAVISRDGGFTAVPFSALDFDPDNNELIFNEDQALFEGAPTYASIDEIGNAELGPEGELFTYYDEEIGLGAEAGLEEGENLFNTSQLIGSQVVSTDGENLGEAEDVILDEQGNVEYVIVDHDGSFVAVPFENFTFDAEAGTLTLEGDASQLDEAPAFSSLGEIDLTDETWDDEIDSFWGVEE